MANKNKKVEKKEEKVEKSYSPVKSGMFYTVVSKYFVAAKHSQCFFILGNGNENFNIVISKIFLSSVVSSIWDVQFDEIYIDGGSPLSIVPFHRGKADLNNLEGITAVSLDRNRLKPIKKVGEVKPGMYRLTNPYSTKEILEGDEIVLSKDNSLCIYVRSEGGVTAPVNCEVRFYIE